MVGLVLDNKVADYAVPTPILFLYRHSFELYLKVLIQKQGREPKRKHSLRELVVRLDDTSLERLSEYASWLNRFLPPRGQRMGHDVTEDMLKLTAFKLRKTDEADASLKAGDTETLGPHRGLRRRRLLGVCAADALGDHRGFQRAPLH